MKRKLLLGITIMEALVSLGGCDVKVQDTTIPTTSEVKSTTMESTTSQRRYTVTFDTMGGSSINEQIVAEKSRMEKPEDPQKEGYTFAGWYLSSLYYFEYDFSKYVTRDITLYAKWDEIPKKISYEVGNSSIDFWTDSINTRWMKIAVPVTNTGEAPLYLDDVSVDIESTSGALLQTSSYINGYPQYIMPGETGYYYKETSCDFKEEDVLVIPNIDLKKSTKEVIRYELSDVSIQSYEYYGIKLIGRVTNNTESDGSLVLVAANLFDKDGMLICNCYTYLQNTLHAGARVGFSMSPFAYHNITPEDVASYEIYAYPYQFEF